MHVFVIIEMADIEVTSVHTYTDEKAARAAYRCIVDENRADEGALFDADISHEVEGTLALAGDDAYSVQLIQSTVETSTATAEAV